MLQMTESQFEQADKIWGKFHTDMVAKLESENEN